MSCHFVPTKVFFFFFLLKIEIEIYLFKLWIRNFGENLAIFLNLHFKRIPKKLSPQCKNSYKNEKLIPILGIWVTIASFWLV